MYQKFQRLQGKYIPICYGIVELDDAVGLLMEDCESKVLREFPENENERFILHKGSVYRGDVGYRAVFGGGFGASGYRFSEYRL